MDDVVSQLRSKMSAHTLDEESGSVEERVERVLRWGAGHVLVTAKDVASATRLVEVALANVNYFRLARVSAICEDPHEPMTKVLTAGGEMIMESGFVELNNQMQALVEQAGKMGQCIFVIVEDGDQASVEQLERLRTTLDPGQEAIERLRLIIVGTKKVAKVLDEYGARGLGSRIGARIDAANTKRRRRKSQPNVPGPAQESSRFRSFVMTAASGTLMATVAIGILQPQLAPTVPVDLLEGLEAHVSELAISFDSIEGPGALLSEETKEKLTSAAALSLKIVHGKGVAHAESAQSDSAQASSNSSTKVPT
ncbi:MAG: hypothetical protein JRJ58_24425, partial [Deltaproteobacteria bacterium]|nr:hypothetical protein [Deltaproteobacteria bacterium]